MIVQCFEFSHRPASFGTNNQPCGLAWSGLLLKPILQWANVGRPRYTNSFLARTRIQPRIKRVELQDGWFPKALTLFDRFTNNRVPAIWTVLSLRNSPFTSKRLNRIDAEFTGHPHHIVKTTTDDRHSKSQSWMRLNDLFAWMGLGLHCVFIDQFCLPELATAIGNRQGITNPQAKHTSEVVGFIVLER
jgi:hypothetical protein